MGDYIFRLNKNQYGEKIPPKPVMCVLCATHSIPKEKVEHILKRPLLFFFFRQKLKNQLLLVKIQLLLKYHRLIDLCPFIVDLWALTGFEIAVYLEESNY